MRKLIIAGAAIIASAVSAQTATQPAAGEDGLDPNERVCRTVADTGSRLTRSRMCKTRAEWVQDRRLTRQNVERTQSNRNPKQF